LKGRRKQKRIRKKHERLKRRRTQKKNQKKDTRDLSHEITCLFAPESLQSAPDLRDKDKQGEKEEGG
jgi:hypothetical protein